MLNEPGCETRSEVESLLTMREVAQRCRYSRPNIYRLIRSGGFPAPLKMAPNGRVLFVEREIDEWMAARPRAALAALNA